MPSARTGVDNCPPSRSRTLPLLVVCCGVFFASPAASQDFPLVTPGQAVSVELSVPRLDGVLPSARHVTPTNGATIEGPIDAPVNSGEITVVVNVPATARPGLFSAATASFMYPDGRRLTTHCYVWVLAHSPVALAVAQGALAADDLLLALDALLEPVQDFGNLLLRISVPALPALAASEASPPAAPADDSLMAPPPTAASKVVQPQPNTLGGVMYVGATDLDMRGGSEADLGMGFDVKGKVNGSTQVNAVYLHGWNPGISPVFRYGMHRSRGHLRVKAPQFSLEAGEIRTETPLSGIRAPVDGMLFQKNGGHIIGSIAAGKPKYFAGGWGGHLFQGSVGFAFRNGAVGFFASQLSRPVRSSRVVANPLPEGDSELVVEDLERVGTLLSRENRVGTGGVESRVRFGSHHLMARGGWLELVNSKNDRISGAAATGSYSFRATRASFSSQFRSMPGSLPGISLSGDLATAVGKFKLVPSLAIVGRTYWNENSLFGRSRPTRGRGAAGGLEYSKDQMRFHVLANYRESQFLSTAITRSIAAGFRFPMGPAAGLDGAVEFGEAADSRRRRRIASFRGSVYVEGETASLMLSGSYRDYGLSSPRLSLDIGGSTGWRGAIIEGGAGVSRAGIFGDVVSGWTTVEFPVPGDLTIMLGADYDRWSFENSPYLIFFAEDNQDVAPPWRFTVNVRRKLSIPVPFFK